MLQIGQQVRVLEPFVRDFSAVYTIAEVITNEDNQVVYIINDANENNINCGFDAVYLEVLI